MDEERTIEDLQAMERGLRERMDRLARQMDRTDRIFAENAEALRSVLEDLAAIKKALRERFGMDV